MIQSYVARAVAAAVLAAAACPLSAAGNSNIPAGKPKLAHVFVFDFHCKGRPEIGAALSDSVRLKLRRHAEYKVIDRITTRELTDPMPISADPKQVIEVTKKLLAADMAVYGTVTLRGRTVRADVRLVDLRRPGKPAGWKKVFTDGSERNRALISQCIVEAITGKDEWKPPEYGDEEMPEKFGKPVNVNGDFERGGAGWDGPDNASTFLVAGPPGRGTILKVRTDLERDRWLEYRRALRMGRASPARAPKLRRDTSFGCVGGLEGVHYRSDWIDAAPGQRYWTLADCKGLGGAKVFIKGFEDWTGRAVGLPESSLAKLGMTPEQFAELPQARRKQLIDQDAKRHPDKHRRECYRWYLNCKAATGTWKTLAAPVPPRGGLPKNVRWINIQVYSYWPPGVYLWDNVFLYKDPAQKTPAPVEKARTPGFGRTSDVVERETSGKAPGKKDTPKSAPARDK